jgi:hypothetical protein
MRTHHIITVIAVILVGFGVRLTQLSSVHAQYVDGEPVRSRSWSSEENHNVKNLPVQNFHDMSLVFAGGDLTTGEIAPATLDEPRKELFTRRCAERDIRAIAVIEEFGKIDEMPSAWLADAGLNWLQARIYCLSGAENEAVILYDKIISGNTQMSSEWTVNARMRR